MFKILTQYSLWYLFFCLLAGLGYAYLLYQKKSPWSKNSNYLLASFRFTLVALLTFLLLGPFLKYFINFTEQPTLVIAVDNSQSISLAEKQVKLDSLKLKLAETAEKFEDADIRVAYAFLDKEENEAALDKLNFNVPTSNISALLQNIQSTYENRNLAGVILLSDGIINQGAAPQYTQYNFPLHTIGLGDTVAKIDLAVKPLLYNKISYKNNTFPIVAEIHNKGFANQTTEVILKKGDKRIESKNINFRSANEITKVEFYSSSNEIGIQHYTVEVKSLKGEFTLQNNRAHAYIDIVENKEKILLIAPSPHPDIKAIRAAIEKKENYEFQLYIPGITEYKEGKYDLVILHQLPDYAGTAKNIIDKFVKENTSILFILGNQSNLNQFNNTNRVLNIVSRQGQKDLVTPFFNEDFSRFQTEKEDQTIIQNYPPLIVPYGEYQLKESADVLLFQKIGNTNSSRPLIASTNDRIQAVITGEGLWQWRQHEYLETQDNKAFDKFIGNLVQFLSAKDDKRKFRVYPTSTEFLNTDPVSFETEIYNDLYEKIYGQKIELKIIDERKNVTSYSYATGENNSRFDVKGLSQGAYTYIATTTLGNKTEKMEGRFTITELNLEALTTTANFELLRQLSSNNNGKFAKPNQLENLAEKIINAKPKNILHTNEELVELISIPWLFFLFLALASTEWFLRKYKGGY